MVKLTDRPVFACWTPLAFLIALALIYAVGLSVIESHTFVPPPEETQGLWMILFSLNLTWWLYADRIVLRFSAPYEFETFAFFAWPLVVPYYLYRTRRGRGLLLFCRWGTVHPSVCGRGDYRDYGRNPALR